MWGGEWFLPVLVFRGDRELNITIKLTPITVSKVMLELWKAFWRKHIARIDAKQFWKWVSEFVKVVCEKYGTEE